MQELKFRYHFYDFESCIHHYRIIIIIIIIIILIIVPAYVFLTCYYTVG
jgi:hypothetical protein